jgi:hypothetical protein
MQSNLIDVGIIMSSCILTAAVIFKTIYDICFDNLLIMFDIPRPFVLFHKTTPRGNKLRQKWKIEANPTQ